MTKLSVEELVRAAVARTARSYSPQQIKSHATLRDLGYSDVAVMDLQTRLAKATSSGGRPSLIFSGDSAITADSTVSAVIDTVNHSLGRPTHAQGVDARSAESRRQQVRAAVIASLSESSSTHDFSQIDEAMTVGELGLDDATIAEAKVDVFKTLAGTDYLRYDSDVKIGPSSTVKSVIGLVGSALPGDGTTRTKGVGRRVKKASPPVVPSKKRITTIIDSEVGNDTGRSVSRSYAYPIKQGPPRHTTGVKKGGGRSLTGDATTKTKGVGRRK
jgi:hypothetical protein